MGMNFLASAPIYTEFHSISLNWIGKIISWLTTDLCGSVGLGIILFSLLLKFVTLPFDIFQRINMRKQNIKMKENKERMEKLQKQYANDKDKYNQKVQEMYRENGLSVMSSCLPMILSLVIFIIAINAFNAFAAYSNVENYNTLVHAYNGKMLENCADINTFDGAKLSENSEFAVKDGAVDYSTIIYTVQEDDKDIYYTVSQSVELTIDENADEEENKTVLENYVTANFTTIKNYIIKADKEYKYDVGSLSSESTPGTGVLGKIEEEGRYEAFKAQVLKENPKLSKPNVSASIINDQIAEKYLIEKAQIEVERVYDNKVKNNTQFFWIKNVWVVDAPYKHPVLSYSNFSQEIIERKSCSCSEGDKSILKNTPYQKAAYKNVTGRLDEEKGAANGYFIMIALSIGTILLQQFISMRSQKEQTKYSSVDGQSGSQQKMMLVIMTGMFAIFSFMYSSAFSIYLVVSNLFSLLSTITINKLVDMSTKRKELAAAGKNGDRVLSGRAAALNRNQDGANKKNKK